MKNKNYQQLNNFKLVMAYIKLRGFVENELLTTDSHVADLEIVKAEIAKRGYEIKERGKQVEFIRA